MTSTQSPESKYTGMMLPEIRITTKRLLGAESTEKVLNALSALDNIRQITIKGENLPAKINSGPNKGLDNNHPERRMIRFGDKDILLTKLVGDFFLELEVENEDMLNASVEDIGRICKTAIPVGFTIDVGRYSKYRPTLSDYKLRC